MTKFAGRRTSNPPPAQLETKPPRSSREKPEKPQESTRDFVEQIVVAIILAILIRGFEAEAFVIPTGSMAPTLKGRHLEITCDQCGYTYTVSADERSEQYVLQNPREDTAICGNCRYQTRTPNEPRFKGDRILVMKFPFEFPTLPGSSPPERWDVIVFHYPEEPETNYIKRMVGLPNDEIRISYGDLHARQKDTNDPFKILHKPLEHQLAMQMTVYDDHYRAKILKDDPAWQRWSGSKNDWSEKAPGEFVSPATSGDEWTTLQYRHLVPDPEQWAAVLEKRPLPRAPRASLITDFYSYNATTTGEPGRPNSAWLQHNWVGDLTVSARITSEQGEGVARFELVEGGVVNACQINLASGLAELFHGDQKLGEAATNLKGKRTCDVMFANVDDRLTLWVDSSTPFGEGLTYDDGPVLNFGPKAADLDPVSIRVKGGSVRVSDLVLKRDIYYTQVAGSPDVEIPAGFGGYDPGLPPILRMFDVLSDPARYMPLMTGIPTRSFAIRPDHYMMMGDNSPRSSDSRMWGQRDDRWSDDGRESWEVPRAMLVGKAFFVYWPHGVPFWPNIGIGSFPMNRDVRVPFRPYVERMRPIR